MEERPGWRRERERGEGEEEDRIVSDFKALIRHEKLSRSRQNVNRLNQSVTNSGGWHRQL